MWHWPWIIMTHYLVDLRMFIKGVQFNGIMVEKYKRCNNCIVCVGDVWFVFKSAWGTYTDKVLHMTMSFLHLSCTTLVELLNWDKIFNAYGNGLCHSNVAVATTLMDYVEIPKPYCVVFSCHCGWILYYGYVIDLRSHTCNCWSLLWNSMQHQDMQKCQQELYFRWHI